MKIVQRSRVSYIKDPEGYIKRNKLTKKQIEEFEDSVKGSCKPIKCNG